MSRPSNDYEEAGSRTIPIPALLPGASITIDNDTFRRILDFDRNRSSRTPLNVALAITRIDHLSCAAPDRIQELRDDEMVIYHICRICKRPRSSRYHREHPVSTDTPPSPPGICQRCRVAAEEARDQDDRTILESAPARERQGRDLIRETVRYVTRNKSRPSKDVEGSQRTLYRHVAPSEVAAIVKEEPAPPRSPSQHSSQKTAEVSTENLAALDTINTQADQIKDLEAKLQEALRSSTELVVQPIAGATRAPGYSESSIRRFARDEVVRYRQAERKIERHPEAYAHGRIVPIEPRTVLEISPQITRGQSARHRVADDQGLVCDQSQEAKTDARTLDRYTSIEVEATDHKIPARSTKSQDAQPDDSARKNNKVVQEHVDHGAEYEVIYTRSRPSSSKLLQKEERPRKDSDLGCIRKRAPVNKETDARGAQPDMSYRQSGTSTRSSQARDRYEHRSDREDAAGLSISTKKTTTEHAQKSPSARDAPKHVATVASSSFGHNFEAEQHQPQRSSKQESSPTSSKFEGAHSKIHVVVESDQDWANATKPYVPAVSPNLIERSKSESRSARSQADNAVKNESTRGRPLEATQPSHATLSRSHNLKGVDAVSTKTIRSTNRITSSKSDRYDRDLRAQAIMSRGTEMSSSFPDKEQVTKSSKSGSGSSHYSKNQRNLEESAQGEQSNEYRYEYRQNAVETIYDSEGVSPHETRSQEPDTMRISEEYFIYKVPSSQDKSKTMTSTAPPADLLPSSSGNQMPTASRSSMRTADLSNASGRARRDSSVRFAPKVVVSPTPPGSDDYPPEPLVARSEARRSERRYYDYPGPSPLNDSERGRRSVRDAAHDQDRQNGLPSRSPAEETDTTVPVDRRDMTRALSESPAREWYKLKRRSSPSSGYPEDSPERRPRVTADRYGPYRREVRGESMEAAYGSSAGRPPRRSVAEI